MNRKKNLHTKPRVQMMKHCFVIWTPFWSQLEVEGGREAGRGEVMCPFLGRRSASLGVVPACTRGVHVMDL